MESWILMSKFNVDRKLLIAEIRALKLKLDEMTKEHDEADTRPATFEDVAKETIEAAKLFYGEIASQSVNLDEESKKANRDAIDSFFRPLAFSADRCECMEREEFGGPFIVSHCKECKKAWYSEPVASSIDSEQT